jgi:hypothetical protein
MTSPYDFISIVVDDDWGLVGIVPPNNAGDRMKKMANSSTHKPVPTELDLSKLQTDVSIEQTDLQSEKESIPKPDVPKPHKFPKAKVINSYQRPIATDPLITPAESIELKKKEISSTQSNILSGLNTSSSETLYASTDMSYSTFESGFGAINRLAATRSRDNLLIGFGKRN